jgi:hypothetical protein
MEELSGQREFPNIVEESCQLDQHALVRRQTEGLQQRRRQQVDAQRMMIELAIVLAQGPEKVGKAASRQWGSPLRRGNERYSSFLWLRFFIRLTDMDMTAACLTGPG